MNYQKLILAGNVTGDAERRQSKKGDVGYTTFGVGVSDGKRRTVFFPVTVFGKYGEVVAEYVTKGRPLLVEGRIDVNPGGRFNVVADQIRLGSLAEKPAGETKKAK